MVRFVFATTILFCAPHPVLAEQRVSITLAGGDRISGVIEKVAAGHMVLTTSHSGVVSIALSSVTSIDAPGILSVDLINGERLIGRVESWGAGGLRITSKTLGSHTVAIADVDTIKSIASEGESGRSRPFPVKHEQMAQLSAMPVAEASLGWIRGKGAEDSVSKDVKPIGQRPEDEDDIRKLFLRQSSVVLVPGQYEVEVGLQYHRTRVNSAVLNSLSRGLSIPLGARIGLAEHWQGFINVPLTYGNQQFSFGADESSFNHTGVGDVAAGVNYQLVKEGGGWPDIVASAGFSAPTGRSPYADEGVGVALGSGHWSANMGMQFVKTEDPVAIFGGINYTYQIARDNLGKRIKPGNAMGYNLGLSFAINDRVSVSGEFIGSVQAETREDGTRLVGTTREPMQFRTGLIYRVSKNWYLAPTVTYSLNTDAPDVVLGVSTSHRFQ